MVAVVPVVAVGVVGTSLGVHAGRVAGGVPNTSAVGGGEGGGCDPECVRVVASRLVSADRMVANEAVMTEREVGALGRVHSRGILGAAGSRSNLLPET